MKAACQLEFCRCKTASKQEWLSNQSSVGIGVLNYLSTIATPKTSKHCPKKANKPKAARTQSKSIIYWDVLANGCVVDKSEVSAATGLPIRNCRRRFSKELLKIGRSSKPRAIENKEMSRTKLVELSVLVSRWNPESARTKGGNFNILRRCKRPRRRVGCRAYHDRGFDYLVIDGYKSQPDSTQWAEPWISKYKISPYMVIYI